MGATVLGVDVLEAPLALARARHGRLHPRLRFEQRSIFDLGLPSGSFDLTVCRHVLQSIPTPERAVADWRGSPRPAGGCTSSPRTTG